MGLESVKSMELLLEQLSLSNLEAASKNLELVSYHTYFALALFSFLLLIFAPFSIVLLSCLLFWLFIGRQDE